MITVTLVQGTPEWLAFRMTKFTASDAAAVLGFSQHKTRSQLLDEKATGVVPDVPAQSQRLFDKGHAAEALARPIVEKAIGVELYPMTAYSQKNERIAASFDGITMLEDFVFEHKLFSQKLIDKIKELDDLPDTHWPQVEQQLYVCGAEKCLFVVSDGTKDNWFEFLYHARAERQKMVLDAWAQFEKDLASHQPTTTTAAVLEGSAPDAMPVLSIVASGGITKSNLDGFKAAARARLDGINLTLTTDQDFANAEKTVKWCKATEENLKATKAAVLAQIADVNEVCSTLEALAEETRQIRLKLDKAVSSEKENRKRDIISSVRTEAQEFLSALNDTLGALAMPFPYDFLAGITEATKGLKTLASFEENAKTYLANLKIELGNKAEILTANKLVFEQEARGFEMLFPDLVSLSFNNSTEAFAAIIAKRIDDEMARRQAESEREKIRVEEQAKAQKADDERTQEQITEVPCEKTTAPALNVRDALHEYYSAHKVVDAVCKYFDVDGKIAAQMIIQAAIELNKTKEVGHG